MDGGQVKDSEPNNTQTQSNSPRLYMYEVIVKSRTEDNQTYSMAHLHVVQCQLVIMNGLNI